jgi:hypothetical protein
MSAVENKRLRKQTFILHKPLTKVPPAKQVRGPEYIEMSAVENKRLRKQERRG